MSLHSHQTVGLLCLNPLQSEAVIPTEEAAGSPLEPTLTVLILFKARR